MRRVVWVLILAAFAVAVLPAGQVAAAEPGPATARLELPPAENLLRNSSFEQNQFWIYRGDAAHAPGEGRMQGGGAYVRGAREYDSEIIQTVGPPLVPGRRYTVTAWVRSTTPDAVAVIGVRWEGGHPRVFRGVSIHDGWSRIEFRFEAPMQPGWRQIVLSGSGGLVWDDVALYEAESLEARLAATWSDRLMSQDAVYTGLVINAKGTDLSRGMNPMIYDESGQLVFAGIGAGDGQLYTQGIVAYANDLGVAVSHSRLEVSEIFPLRLPLVIDAQGTRGSPRTSVVVGQADAERIRRAVQNYDFLGRFSIVFVVEPFAGL